MANTDVQSLNKDRIMKFGIYMTLSTVNRLTLMICPQVSLMNLNNREIW